MGTTDGLADSDLAAPVRSILAAAAEREAAEKRISVDARPFVGAIESVREDGRAPVIAEIKPTSPTTEATRDLDPVETARSMVEGGACAISVLTEPDHFGGSVETLSAVRAAVSVPVLRKDFILREAHLDAVAADAVLLIARFLDDLTGLIAAAQDRGMTPLVETHTREEVRQAVSAGAAVIGVNNRDLATLSVDRSTVESVAPAVPTDCTLIAESGIETPAHRDRMLAAGADGLLVGSAIVAGDVTDRTARLVER